MELQSVPLYRVKMSKNKYDLSLDTSSLVEAFCFSNSCTNNLFILNNQYDFTK